jgi:AmmeMemoRadiSam system protein B
MFYPGEAKRLIAAVEAYLADARPAPDARPRRVGSPPVPTQPQPPKAIIAPHAGYQYSGPIAGSAYGSLIPHAKGVERVILVGPSHRVPFAGVAASRAAAFETPLGVVPVDRDAIEALIEDGLIVENDAAHAREHSLEVHLPFVQRVFPGARVVPLLAGDHDFTSVAAILARLWGGPETVIVVSSDLSHYHDYETACRLDRETADTIEARHAGSVDSDQACGATPVNALLQIAADKGLSAATIDLRNSGDTAGPRDQVVGYGAFVLG